MSVIEVRTAMQHCYGQYLDSSCNPAGCATLSSSCQGESMSKCVHVQNKMEGPPFSVTRQQVHELFDDAFTVESLSRDSIIDTEKYWKKRGMQV